LIPATALSDLRAWATPAAPTPLTLTKLSTLTGLTALCLLLSALPLLLTTLPLLLTTLPLLLTTLSQLLTTLSLLLTTLSLLLTTLSLLLTTLSLLLTTLSLLLTTLSLLLSALSLTLSALSLTLTTLPLLLTTLPLLLSRLPPQWILPAPRQGLDLVAKPFDVIERGGLLTLALRGFPRAHPLLRLVDLLAQLIQTLADTLFRSIRVGIHSAAEPVGSSLYSVRQISLVHTAQRIAQLRSCLRLRRRQLTGLIPQILFQLRKIVGQLLPVLRQFVALLQPGCIVRLARCLPTASQPANAIGLGMFFLAQAVAFPGQGIQLARSLLLLRTAHKARRLAKLISRLLSSLRTLRLPGATLHLLISLTQPV
jgi:hypothetical protein